MNNLISKIFSAFSKNNFKTQNHNPLSDDFLKIATCVLLQEIAYSDGLISKGEEKKILSAVKTTFDLSTEETMNIINLSKEKRKESVSLYEFTKVVNTEFSKDEKFNLLLNLWRIIYADKTLDKYEDNLIKKIGALINVEHKDIISAKLTVKNELSLK